MDSLLGRTTTVSYLKPAQTDDALIAVYDLHITSLVQNLKAISALLVGLFTLCAILNIWFLIDLDAEGAKMIVSIIAGVYGAIIGILGILLGAAGWRSAILKSRNSSMMFSKLFYIFFVFFVLYLGLILIGTIASIMGVFEGELKLANVSMFLNLAIIVVFIGLFLVEKAK